MPSPNYGELGPNETRGLESVASENPALQVPPIVSLPGKFNTHRAPQNSGRSLLERFVENFVHETSIKWMLLVGAAIVFGSSLMLVTRHWADWSGTLKFLTVLGYTSVIYLVADICRNRLALLKTATVLQGLTVLLLPTCFIALSWFVNENSSHTVLGWLKVVVLTIPALSITWFAASRIFDHWLRGRQTAFLVSYVVLAMAGACPALDSPWLAVAFSLLCWGIMTVGVVKVNRHVFWLTEENRWPRVFGFLPISILTLLFAILVTIQSVHALPLEWMGLQCVLVGATVLMTARTVANVFRQRTGDALRPLPWHIAVPLFVGLSIIALGVCQSFYGFSYVGASTMAAVPTLAIAAVLLSLVAMDTRHGAFVWAALLLATAAYQCTPTLMAELVQQVKAAAASAVHESRLPIAFYGITYLPLILAYACGSRLLAIRGETVFSRPMKRFATILTLVLFAMALTHLKALHLVSVLNVVLFVVLAIVLRDRRYTLGTLIALPVAAASFIPFANATYSINIPQAYILTSLLVLVCGMILTPLPDRLLGLIWLPTSSLDGLFRGTDGKQRHLFFEAGHGILVLLSSYKIIGLVFGLGLGLTNQHLLEWSTIDWVHITLLLCAWCLITVRSKHYFAGMAVWVIVATTAGCQLAHLELAIAQVIEYATIVIAVCSLASGLSMRWLYRREPTFNWKCIRVGLGFELDGKLLRADGDQESRQTFAAFAVPLRDLTLLAMILLLIAVHVPQLILTSVTLDPIFTPVATSTAVVWSLVTASFFQSRTVAVVATGLLPVFSSALAISMLPSQLSYGDQTLIWSIIVCIESLVLLKIKGSVQQRCQAVCTAWALFIFSISCLSLDGIFRVAGCCSLVALYLSQGLLKQSLAFERWAILANLQLLFLAAHFGGLNGGLFSTFEQFSHLHSAKCWLMSAMGLSLLVLNLGVQRFEGSEVRSWVKLLRCVFILQFLDAFNVTAFSAFELAMVALALIMFAASEFLRAVKYQLSQRVCTSLGILALLFVWLDTQNVIQLGTGASQLVLVALTIAFMAIGRVLTGHSTLGFSAGVFNRVADAGPAIIAVLAVVRETSGSVVALPGLNTLALFTSVGLYFYRWMNSGEKRYILASGAILNVSLVLLWKSVGLHDAQLYLVPLGLSILGLVEILSRELPRSSHTPLRYVGALTILVSPIFQILDGSWLHLFSLMALSVLVILLAIGLRVRALANAGSGFLLADLVAMVVRSSIDNPSLLWVSGFGLGIAVIALAAYCENHREKLLSKIRLLSAELATWS